MKKTKIVCTVGPATNSKDMLRKMFRAGMNGARINTAYGSVENYRVVVANIREVADVPIIIDVKGPEVRLRVKEKQILKEGDFFEVGKGKSLSFSCDIYGKLGVGDDVLIDNGRLRTRVAEKRGAVLRLLAVTGGEVADGKGVNVPRKRLDVPTLSTRDREMVRFARESDCEFIALSFTRKAEDVENLRKEADGFGGGVIAKIENSEGVVAFDEVLEAADGVMVARGDLGVEIEPERVPLVQKSLIRRCNQKGKLVITATEMLESMIHQPFPTRAEVSDVANAILDGTDATMLSGETAVGQFSVESVLMMSRIARETEKVVQGSVEDEGFVNVSDTVSRAVEDICAAMPVNKVVTLTRSGYTARMISRFKIHQPIVAVTPDAIVRKQLELSYGVIPVRFDYTSEDDRVLAAVLKLRSLKVIRDRDTVLFTAASRTSKPHSSNVIEIHNVGELRKTSET